jgi:Ca2+-binding EF-hand superfamily protein
MAEAAISPEHKMQLKTALHHFFWKGDESVLPEAFRLFDLNGNGVISMEELTSCLHGALEEYASVEEMTEMFQEADTNKNGNIELDEFIAILKKHKDSNLAGWGRLNLFDRIGGATAIQTVVDKAY